MWVHGVEPKRNNQTRNPTRRIPRRKGGAEGPGHHVELEAGEWEASSPPQEEVVGASGHRIPVGEKIKSMGMQEKKELEGKTGVVDGIIYKHKGR